MFGWFRKALKLDADRYKLWLWAQKPSLELFLSLSDLEQTALAQVGQEYNEELVRLRVAVAQAMDEEDSPDPAEVQAAKDQVSEATRQALSFIGERIGGVEEPSTPIPDIGQAVRARKEAEANGQAQAPGDLFGAP